MTEIEANPFYSTPLGRCIVAGDITAVMDTVDAMPQTGRAAALVGVQALMIDRWKLVRASDHAHANRLFRAVELARFMCSPDLPPADYWMHIGIQDIAAFKQRYRPDHPGKGLERQVRGDHGWDYRHRIHRAVVAGLMPRPDTQEYLESLFFPDLRQASNVVLKHVDADPDLAPWLLRLFELEGASDTSFAAVEKYCHDPALHWSAAFLTLCERGVYTRTQLLDKTLGALSCDWPQFKSGWFSRFHGSLAPTSEEMAVHAPRYLALCHSRIAPTVTLAMEAVTNLYRSGGVTQAQLFDAVKAVLSSAVKAHVLAALAVLGDVVRQDPVAANQASGLAVLALAHTGADMQKKAIACLKLWGMDADARAAAEASLALVAAVNQAALRSVLGTSGGQSEAPMPEPTAVVGPGFAPGAAPVSPIEASRSIAPLNGTADLIECIAYVIENPVDTQAWERAAEALVRMARLPAGVHAAFGALRKRANRLSWQDQPLAFALAQLMACALGDAVAPSAMDETSRGLATSADFVAWRTRSLLALAKRGSGLAPLSSPTHRGGFVEPRQFKARLAAYVQAGLLPDPQDHALALMRQMLSHSAPGTAAAPGWTVSSSDGEYVVHSLHIHADLSAADEDAGGGEISQQLTRKFLTHGQWQSERDAANIRFMASLRPGDLDAFYAEGAHALGNNLDWWEANWQNRAYLDVLLESTLPLTPMARLLIALALAGKEAGQGTLAVDALAQCLHNGRVTPEAMGETLAALWATPLVKGPRLARSLAAAAMAHVGLPLAVYPLLCAMVAVNPAAPRKDSAPLLELMLELQLAHKLALPAGTRQILAAQKLTGKARAAVQALLA